MKAPSFERESFSSAHEELARFEREHLTGARVPIAHATVITGLLERIVLLEREVARLAEMLRVEPKE